MQRAGWLAWAFALSTVGCSASGNDKGTALDPIGGGNGGGDSDAGAGGGGGGGNGGNGAGNNGQSGSGNGASNGDEFCESVTVRAEKTIPDLMIVLDKSASMVWVGCDQADAQTANALGCPNADPPYDQAFDRWEPSVSAIKTITASLEDRVQFGLMVFPMPDIPNPILPGVLAPTTCQPGEVLVAPALNNAGQIATELDAEVPDGTSTPIAGTLRAAHDFLGSGIAAPDEVVPPKFVLLVTDGFPNCSVDNQPAALIGSPSLQQCQMDAYNEVTSLQQDNIKTYVIGYDTRTTPELATILDELARRGGTGDTAHRPVEDEASLLAAIDAIAGEVASCTYQLEKAPGDPTYVRVTLDGMDLKLGDPDGWELSDDATINLRGSACDTIQDITTKHKLDINVECDPVFIQ